MEYNCMQDKMQVSKDNDLVKIPVALFKEFMYTETSSGGS